jgi:hypothetical protein
MKTAAQKKQEQRKRQAEGVTLLPTPVRLAELAETLVVHRLLAEIDLENREAIAQANGAFIDMVCGSGRVIPLVLKDREARLAEAKQRQNYKARKPHRTADHNLGWAFRPPTKKELAERKREREALISIGLAELKLRRRQEANAKRKKAQAAKKMVEENLARAAKVSMSPKRKRQKRPNNKTVKPIQIHAKELSQMEEALFGNLREADSSPHFVAMKAGEFDARLDSTQVDWAKPRAAARRLDQIEKDPNLPRERTNSPLTTFGARK